MSKSEARRSVSLLVEFAHAARRESGSVLAPDSEAAPTRETSEFVITVVLRVQPGEAELAVRRDFVWGVSACGIGCWDAAAGWGGAEIAGRSWKGAECHRFCSCCVVVECDSLATLACAASRSLSRRC